MSIYLYIYIYIEDARTHMIALCLLFQNLDRFRYVHIYSHIPYMCIYIYIYALDYIDVSMYYCLNDLEKVII